MMTEIFSFIMHYLLGVVLAFILCIAFNYASFLRDAGKFEKNSFKTCLILPLFSWACALVFCVIYLVCFSCYLIGLTTPYVEKLINKLSAYKRIVDFIENNKDSNCSRFL